MQRASSYDLHLHSIISDGNFTPEQIIRHCIMNNVALFSITDHDILLDHSSLVGNVHQQLLNQKIKFNYPIIYVPGVEVSVIDDSSQNGYHLCVYDTSQTLFIRNPNKEPVYLSEAVNYAEQSAGLLRMLTSCANENQSNAKYQVNSESYTIRANQPDKNLKVQHEVDIFLSVKESCSLFGQAKQDLQVMLSQIRANRIPRLKSMFDMLLSQNVPVNFLDFKNFCEISQVPGRRHLAKYLQSVNFDAQQVKLLMEQKELQVEASTFTFAQLFQAVDGAVVYLAHPDKYRNIKLEDVKSTIQQLNEHYRGKFQGLEAFSHRSSVWVRNLAQTLNLKVTGGSDMHDNLSKIGTFNCCNFDICYMLHSLFDK